MQFFAEHKLTKDGQKQYKEFQEHIQQMQSVIEKEKDKVKMSQIQKLRNTLYKDILTRKQQRNYQSMAKIMIDYYKIIDDLQGYEDQELVNLK